MTTSRELHVYFSELGLLRVSWGRRITLESARRHFELLKASDHYARSLRTLSSMVGVEIAFELSDENMTKLQVWRLEAASRYERIRAAYFGLAPVPAAYLDYFGNFFDAPNSTVRQFATEREARAWLMRPFANAPSP